MFELRQVRIGQLELSLRRILRDTYFPELPTLFNRGDVSRAKAVELIYPFILTLTTFVAFGTMKSNLPRLGPS